LEHPCSDQPYRCSDPIYKDVAKGCSKSAIGDG
jgi:hypothetical protein